MNIRESSYGYWTSARAFVWVAAGACIGIGNIARLPYLMGHYGGWEFLAVYVIALLVMGLPLLVAEWALGRWMRDEIVSGFGRLAQTANASGHWRLVGGFTLVGAAMILSYYSVIAGWSLGFVFRAASGHLAGDATVASRRFLDLAQDPERSLGWHTLFMLMICVIVGQGFRQGMERAAAYFVPTAFVALLLILLAAVGTGDPLAAANYLFLGADSRLTLHGALEALQQAFFSLALGFGSMLTLGAYLPSSMPLGRLGLFVILLHLAFSLLCGLILVSFVLGAGMQPSSGMVMIFQTLPQALPENWIGIAVATAFYLVLFLVTLVSGAALMEPLTRYLMERLRLTRVFAATAAVMMVWFLGLGSLLSFSVFADLSLFGRNYFEWMQLLSATLVAPLCALMICFLMGHVLPIDLARSIAGPRAHRWTRVWIFMLSYPARMGLMVILLFALGVCDWLARLWGMGDT